MNIYARFFDQDVLVHSVEEVIDFLQNIPDIVISQELVDDIHRYVESDMPYPKRYKIRPRVYFILIKTTAETMAEFKNNRRQQMAPPPVQGELMNRKEYKVTLLTTPNFGWYHCTLTFKRVILIPGTNKFQYQDTPFEAFIKANSGQECYNRIMEYLKGRQDIDMRSQFPSAKGSSFQFEYIGENLAEGTEDTDGPDSAKRSESSENTTTEPEVKVPVETVSNPEMENDSDNA